MGIMFPTCDESVAAVLGGLRSRHMSLSLEDAMRYLPVPRKNESSATAQGAHRGIPTNRSGAKLRREKGEDRQHADL